MLAVLPSAMVAAPPGDDAGGSAGIADVATPQDAAEGAAETEEDYEDIEDYYDGNETIYNLENEEDESPAPDEEEPPADPDMGDPDDEIYTTFSFDTDNAAQLDGASYVLDEILIKFKEPWQVPGKEKQLQQEISKLEKVGFVEGLGVYVVKVADLARNPNAIFNMYKNNKYVEYVEPNYILNPVLTPNDPNFSSQRLSAMMTGAIDGWDIIHGSSLAVIAVVDSGIAIHPDLPPLLPGYSAVAGLSPNNDKVGHGTSVAGVIGAIGNNSRGTAGINWNASIMPVKVDDANGNLATANTAKGIIWAADNGARIINLSLGSASDSVTMKNAIDYAYNKGCVIIAATGNDGRATVSYPARYANVMAVGGTSDGKNRLNISNYGAGMGVATFASYVSTTAAGGYATAGGTSFAAPQIAGMASLILGLNPALTNAQVYDLIRLGASGGGAYLNDEMGYGFINHVKTYQLTLATLTSGGGTAPPAPVIPPETPPEPPPPPVTPPETPPETPPAPVIPPETPPEPPRTPPVITLTGFAAMALEYGQAYIENGYSAVDCKGADLTASVTVTGTVDHWKAGLYTITYEVKDPVNTALTARATRTVTVSPKPPDPPPPTAPKITINGSNPIILHRDSATPYTEQRAKAVDHNGADISSLVTVSGWSAANRKIANTYTITYRITSPATGLSSTATRTVRIVAPTEKRDPRVSYNFSGQAKAGAKVTHTGVLCSSLGFMDLSVTAIDKNMTITVQLVDTATKKAALTDTFSATGKKQYKIDPARYELVVTIVQANGNSKYSVSLLMPETAPTYFYDVDEVPLTCCAPVFTPQIAPIGSNPIILHIGGTPYFEQGARASDHLGNPIPFEIDGKPDTSAAGTYIITYRTYCEHGNPVTVTRQVRVFAPRDATAILPDEVPLGERPPGTAEEYTVVAGDSLWRISQKYYGTGTRWGEIYDLNKDVIGANPGLIRIGTVLIIMPE